MEGGPSMLAIVAFTDSLLLIFYAYVIFDMMMHACTQLRDLLLSFYTRPQFLHRPFGAHTLVLCPEGLLTYRTYTVIIANTVVIHKLLDMKLVLTCPPTLSYDKGIGFS